jgi:hypothetical protein
VRRNGPESLFTVPTTLDDLHPNIAQRNRIAIRTWQLARPTTIDRLTLTLTEPEDVVGRSSLAEALAPQAHPEVDHKGT